MRNLITSLSIAIYAISLLIIPSCTSEEEGLLLNEDSFAPVYPHDVEAAWEAYIEGVGKIISHESIVVLVSNNKVSALNYESGARLWTYYSDSNINSDNVIEYKGKLYLFDLVKSGKRIIAEIDILTGNTQEREIGDVSEIARIQDPKVMNDSYYFILKKKTSSHGFFVNSYDLISGESKSYELQDNDLYFINGISPPYLAVDADKKEAFISGWYRDNGVREVLIFKVNLEDGTCQAIFNKESEYIFNGRIMLSENSIIFPLTKLTNGYVLIDREIPYSEYVEKVGRLNYSLNSFVEGNTVYNLKGPILTYNVETLDLFKIDEISEEISYSRDREYIAYIDRDELNIFKIKIHQLMVSIDVPFSPSAPIEFSDDFRFIYLSNNERVFAYPIPDEI